MLLGPKVGKGSTTGCKGELFLKGLDPGMLPAMRTQMLLEQEGRRSDSAASRMRGGPSPVCGKQDQCGVRMHMLLVELVVMMGVVV